MNRRRLPRSKLRLACTLHLEESLHSGMVLDVSAGGLFVQTNASPAPGTLLRLEVRVPGLPAPIEMQAKVARKRIVPPRLRALLKGGIGLQLDNPPEEFYALVAKLQAPEIAEESKAPQPSDPAAAERAAKQPPAKPKLTSFRVKLSQVGGEGSRILVIRASHVDEASRRAILDLGDGWKVLSCEPK
jgi:Tfp pilus assembly protein PilZ